MTGKGKAVVPLRATFLEGPVNVEGAPAQKSRVPAGLGAALPFFAACGLPALLAAVAGEGGDGRGRGRLRGSGQQVERGAE
jgi:hypothetical protein